MASLYKRPRSPFWWIKFRDHRTGEIKRIATHFRHGMPSETRSAQELRAQKTLLEVQNHTSNAEEQWERWVPQYLAVTYTESPKTLDRYSIIWRNLAIFLDQKNLRFPRLIQRHHCFDYLNWRQQPNPSIGMFAASHNTARGELKFLGLILSEAVRRNYCAFNPCRELKIPKRETRPKPEFTDEDIALVLERANQEREPLRTFYLNSFTIARWQGCRLSETHLNPQTAVNLEKNQITFLAKGRKHHVTFLHPKLRPLMEQLIHSGATETYQKPEHPSQMWHHFFRRINLHQKLPGICFHSLRVTAITRVARSGTISETKAMRFFGHASTTVHRTYQRLKAEDLADCADALT